MSAIAFFDLDGTLIEGDSLRMFLAFLVTQRHVGVSTLAAAGGAFLARRFRLLSLVEAKELTLRSLTGTSESLLREWARDFWQKRGRSVLRGSMIERLEWHRDAGHRVVILTSAPDLHLAEALNILGADECHGTPMVLTADARYSGRLGAHLFGEAKSARLQEIVDRTGLSTTYAYADHVSDVPMLRSATHAYAVAPCARLRAEAARNGWTICEQ